MRIRSFNFNILTGNKKNADYDQIQFQIYTMQVEAIKTIQLIIRLSFKYTELQVPNYNLKKKYTDSNLRYSYINQDFDWPYR